MLISHANVHSSSPKLPLFRSHVTSLVLYFFLVHPALSTKQLHLNDCQATSRFLSLRVRQLTSLSLHTHERWTVTAPSPAGEWRFSCLTIFAQSQKTCHWPSFFLLQLIQHPILQAWLFPYYAFAHQEPLKLPALCHCAKNFNLSNDQSSLHAKTIRILGTAVD